jgi:DNA-binding GntR family transcriptional regulator
MNQAENILPMSLFMGVDRAGPIPLYFQISQTIEAAIMSGTLPAGSRLENEVTLGQRLGLSRPTVRRAIQELVDKGLLVRRRGIGTQVVHGRVTRSVELTSLYEDLAASGKVPTTTLLDLRVEPADAKLAERLAVDEGSDVVYIHRVRLADDVPVSVLINWLPIEFSDLTADDLGAHGLYQLLRARGVDIRVAKQRIGARKASAEEAGLLRLDRGSAVLTMDRTAYDNSGQAVEFGHHCYHPDLYAFEVTLVDR